MNELAAALSPPICKRLDLECSACVSSRAKAVARISPGVSGPEAAQVFRVLYPSGGCAPMRELFMTTFHDEIGLGISLGAGRRLPTVA